MAIQLVHEALAERHNLAVAFPLRVKIASALAAADGQTGQRILKDLLKAEELDDAQIDARMQAQTALIRTDCAGELHAEAVVHLHLPLVIHPRHAEENLPLRHGQPLKQSLPAISFLIALDDRTQRVKHFTNSLMKLRLAGILAHNALINLVNVRHQDDPPSFICFSCGKT